MGQLRVIYNWDGGRLLAHHLLQSPGRVVVRLSRLETTLLSFREERDLECCVVAELI